MLLTKNSFTLASLAIVAVASGYGQLPEVFPLQIRAAISYLGLGLRDLDEAKAKSLKMKDVNGAEVTAVETGGAGDSAGIRPGDVVVSYNGETVLGAQQFTRLVQETPQGRRVRIECLRGGQKKEIWVTTGAPHTTPDAVIFKVTRITDVPSPMMLWRNLLLGIESEALNEQVAQAFGVKQGILIWTVSEGSPGQRAGLRAGDIVTGFAGHPVGNPREFGLALQQCQELGKAGAVSLMRDHKALSVAIPLAGDAR